MIESQTKLTSRRTFPEAIFGVRWWKVEERIKHLLVLGRGHYERKEYDKAEPLLTQVLAAHDRYADVHNMMGVILHERGELDLAADHFARAIALNPGYTEARLNLVVCFNDLGRSNEARAVYDELGHSKNDGGRGSRDDFALGKIANMHADIAQAYVEAGCPKEAIEELKRACALRPKFADLRVKLASYYADAGMPQQGREELEKACEANPAYVPARIALGVAYLSLGQPEQARHHFELALAIDPTARTARMYLRYLDSHA